MFIPPDRLPEIMKIFSEADMTKVSTDELSKQMGIRYVTPEEYEEEMSKYYLF